MWDIIVVQKSSSLLPTSTKGVALERNDQTRVLCVLHIRSNRNDVMRHMPLFYTRSIQSSEMAGAPKITFRSHGI